MQRIHIRPVGARLCLASLVALLLSTVIATIPTALAQSRGDSKSSLPGPRIALKPKFVPGTVMRYRIELESTSETKRTGIVQDPQGPSHLAVTWDATLRLEVLPAPAKTPAAPAQLVRLRITYEKSSATVESDTPDPHAADTEKQYTQLEGRSIEFTVSADGHISDVQGLEGILPDDKAGAAAAQWMSQISSAATVPAGGVVPGQKWTTQEPATTLPLAGLVWRTDSTYLRNEPCHPANPAGVGAAQPGDLCAVILARLDLAAPRALKDPTPEEYRRNGLHSAGRWTGAGESLTYVSLENGWVVSVTQNASEEMDVTVSRAQGAAVRYAGSETTRSQMSLVGPEP